MKKVLLILITILLLTGCNKLSDLPNNPIIFKTGEFTFNENDSYESIIYNDKEYILYGGIKGKGIFKDFSYAFGSCLGYIENDKNDRIYLLKGESSDIWLIKYYVNGMMEEPMIFREISSKDAIIPASVISFNYDYWK